MKKVFYLYSLLALILCASSVVFSSCEKEDDSSVKKPENENGGNSDSPNTPAIKGPKWVLVGYEAPTYTESEIVKHNSNRYNPNYHTDSLKMIAAKSTCSGFYSETFTGDGDWHGGTFLFRFEVTKIPQELEGNGTITLYSKASLPIHYGGHDNHNDYAEYAYYHCFCYPDCRIDGNKIRSKEDDFDKFNGYNLPVVIFNENQKDLFNSEGYIYGDVPQGKKAGDKIKLTIDAVEGAGGPTLDINGKYMTATYTYEWRE